MGGSEVGPGIGGGGRVEIGGGGEARLVPQIHADVDTRPRRAAVPGQVLGKSQYRGCPPGFYELLMQKQLDEETDDGVLFKYVHAPDTLKDFDIQKSIYLRVALNMIECVVLRGVKPWELRVLGYMLNHVVGPILANLPTPDDNSKLRHIGDVTNKSSSKDVYEIIAKNIDENAYPMHFVISARFNVRHSPLMMKISSNHTIKRIVQAMRD